jgi:hypothetical protein
VCVLSLLPLPLGLLVSLSYPVLVLAVVLGLLLRLDDKLLLLGFESLLLLGNDHVLVVEHTVLNLEELLKVVHFPPQIINFLSQEVLHMVCRVL